jgi:sugar O-acyltransferase (sialic acid O-acetyltransferase NeuD family)
MPLKGAILMNDLYAIYGASGLGREVMPLARIFLAQNNIKEDILFIDDGLAGQVLNGHHVVSFEQFSLLEANRKFVCIAIANSEIRKNLFYKLVDHKIDHWSISASNVILMDDCKVGENSLLAPFVTMTSNISIGKSFQANIYSYVAHDCIIGDFVTFAPSVKCNGNVQIGNHAYLGTGVIVKQGKPGRPLIIGEGAIVGAGAVVTKNVPPFTTVIGNPARPLNKDSIRGAR